MICKMAAGWTTAVMAALSSEPLISDPAGNRLPMATVAMSPPWPAPAFRFACPPGEPQSTCDMLDHRHGCFEPDDEVAEVVTSFLAGCGAECLYVDIGCNMGWFAVQAATMGARVECYEPTPFFITGSMHSARINGVQDRFRAVQAAVVRNDAEAGVVRNFTSAYFGCYVGAAAMAAYRAQHGGRKAWQTRTLRLRSILAGKHVTLLKMDIDYNEGELLHDLVAMLRAGETRVDTFVIELGDSGNTYIGKCRVGMKCAKRGTIRGGDLRDVIRLQEELGYDVYRINVHTLGEVFDWTGANVNPNVSATPPAVIPMYGIRAMRKLEKVRNHTSVQLLRELPLDGSNFLFTRVQLARRAHHHRKDMEWITHLAKRYHTPGYKGKPDLNRGNPVKGLNVVPKRRQHGRTSSSGLTARL